MVLVNVATFERKPSLNEGEGNSSGLFLSLRHRDSAMILQVIITPQPSLHSPSPNAQLCIRDFVIVIIIIIKTPPSPFYPKSLTPRALASLGGPSGSRTRTRHDLAENLYRFQALICF